MLTKYDQYKVVTTTEDPGLPEDQQFTSVETTLYHPDESSIPDGTTIVTVFEDANGALWKYENEQLVGLESAEIQQYLAAKGQLSETHPDGAVKVDTLKDSDGSTANSDRLRLRLKPEIISFL